LKRLNWTSGVIEGHTDSIGKDAYNQKLSERRALAVREYLAAQGIAESRMIPTGFGESQPVADNKTAEGRAENRRVVLRRTDCDKPQ
jgi:OOP family OmpA-OmpF porin